MPVTAVVGAQWGDEGKGKIVDLLAQQADIVCRFGGGSNAGHTVVNEFGSFRLHSLPSGIFNPATLNVVGTGTVVDFDSLTSELAQIRDARILDANLIISDRAHVVMPYHQALDRLKEESLGSRRVGTTRRGIGPTYVDKVDRTGIQAGELLDLDGLQYKLSWELEQKNRLMSTIYHGSQFQLSDLMDRLRSWRDEFGRRIVDTLPIIEAAVERDDRVLLEGQLGVMRDLDWGTYPYVTSSTTFAAGGASGAGVPPRSIQDVVGVVKAYTSAVGEGPLPTELTGPEGNDLRERGKEYGATTGRPRRVGWLDGVALRYAAAIGAFTRLAVTKLDVLDGVDPIRIAVAYEVGGTLVDTFPHPSRLSEAKPVYEEIQGWSESTRQARSWEDLPSAAQNYLRRISELAAAPVSMIGVGQSRSEIVRVAEPAVSITVA